MTAVLMGTTVARPAMPGGVVPSGRTRLRLTRRGRLVFTALAALPIVVGVLIGSLASGGAVAGIDDGAGPAVFDTVVVGAGDTLWGIAESLAPTADPRDVIHEIMQLNGLREPVVQPGQRLALPVVE